MYGYESIYNRSMNGVKSISDGQAIITDGNLTAVNVTATNLYGTITTPAQTNITSLGTLTSLTVSGNTSLNTLGATGVSTLKAVNCDALTTSVNSNIAQSGTGVINQTGTGINTMKQITMNSGTNIIQSGTGILSQSGSGTNAIKASNIVGQFGLAGDLVQTSGSNTLYDTSFYGDINNNGNTKISQAIGGTGVNALNTTTITHLTVTNTMTIPSGVTMPSATYNGDTSYIGTAKIIQSGSTGINDFNGSTFNGNVSVSGNFNMTGGSATSTLKTPTISGLTTCEGITQTSGTSALRGLTCNQLDINSNYDLNFAGTGKIGQTSATGTNLMNAITLNSNRDLTFAGTGRINQNSSTGANIFQASTFNGNLGLAVDKTVNFVNSFVNPRKLLLYDVNSGTQFNQFGLGVESGLLRYNVGATTSNHIFSTSNGTTATGYNELMRLNSSGLGIGVTPSFKLHVLGTTKLDGANTFTTSLNGVTPATFAFLDATSSIQTQLNNSSSTGSSNSSAITALQTKTTDLTYSSSVSTFANSLNCQALTSTTANHTGLITGSNGLTISSGNTSLQTVGATTATISTGLNINSSTASSRLQGDVTLWGDATFPTTSTSTQGLSTYITSGNGVTRMLNRAQGGSGGFTFHTVNVSHAPYLIGTLDSSGSLTLPSHLNAVNGVFSGNVSTAGHTSTSLNTGNITGTGSLSIATTSTLTGAVTCGNNLSVTGTSALTGNVTCANNLSVTGTSGLTGNVTCGNNLSVTGTSGLTGAVTCSNNLSVTGTSGLTGAVTCSNNLSVTGTSTLTGNVTCANNLSVTGTTSLTGDLSTVNLNVAGQIVGDGLKVYAGEQTSITQTLNNDDFTLLVATFISTPYYSRTYKFVTPMSCNLTYNGSGGTFGHFISAVGCTVYKNGVAILTPTVNRNRSLPTVDGFTSTGASSSANFFVMTTDVTFTIPPSSGTNTYTVYYNITKSSTNSTIKTIYINTAVSAETLVTCVRNANALHTGYVAPYFEITNSSLGSVNTGYTEMNDCHINQYLRAPGVAGAQLMTQTAIPINIYTSVTNYTDFYPNTGATILAGSYNAPISYNDYDRSYIIMPNYRLQVWDNTNYTGTLVLDVYNPTLLPINCQPSSWFVGSSCKLYFGGILI